MAYVNNNLDNQIVTPEHYLSINIKTGISVMTIKKDDEKADSNYHVEEKTSEKLLESWKKGQRHLEQFWKLWKNHYLLREKSQLFKKHPRV